MKVTYKANIPQTIAQIEAWSNEKKSALRDVTNEYALNIQAGAKRRVPTDTGLLKSRIVIEPADWGDFSLKIGTRVFYAPYVEWGTGKFASHPDIPGRSTPWAFPVPQAGRTVYNWRRLTIDGQEYYLTSGAKPHPFLLPAFEEEKPKYEAAVKAVFRS